MTASATYSERLATAIAVTLCNGCRRAFDGHCGGGFRVTRCGSFDPVPDRSGSIDPDTGDCRSEVSA